jgi:hypothetical protein
MFSIAGMVCDEVVRETGKLVGTEGIDDVGRSGDGRTGVCGIDSCLEVDGVDSAPGPGVSNDRFGSKITASA